MKENNSLIQKSKLMIGLFSFLGIMMVFAIVTTNLTSKGTYSATTMTCSCKDGGTWSQSEGICKKTTSSVDTKTCSSNASGDGCATYKSNGYSCEAISSSAQGATFSCTKTIYNDASYTPPASDCKVSCDAGKYLSTDGTCKTCPAGYYCVGGESGTHLCDAGKYCPNEGMSVGLTCPANSYCGSGAKSPTSCPDGKISPAGSKFESDCVSPTPTPTPTSTTTQKAVSSPRCLTSCIARPTSVVGKPHLSVPTHRTTPSTSMPS